MRKTFTLLLASLFFLQSSFAQNKGLNFDGVNDYVTIPAKAGVLNGGAFTVETWIKPTSASFGSYLLRNSDDNYTNGLEFWITNNYIEVDMYLANGNTPNIPYTIPSSWNNQWHHVAVTYTATTLTLYIDGVQVGTTATGLSQAFTGAPLYLGAYDAANTSPFPGVMDELRIWNVARTQAQIQATMNTEISAGTAGLTAYYRFNQGTANGNNAAITTAVDYRSANNGTLINFALNGTTSNFVPGYNFLTVLALKDASFTATKTTDGIRLNWTGTASQESSFFSVERSSNGVDFTSIGTVAAPPATVETAYSFTDRTVPSSMVYYRIKSTTADGRVTYSKTIAVNVDKSLAALSIYPNPASSLVNLQVTAPKGVVLIEVKDLGGRTAQAMQVVSEGNAVYTTLDVSKLAKGTYTITAGKAATLLIKQ